MELDNSLILTYSILTAALFFVFYIGSILYVYNDAEKHRKTGCLWALLLWFTWPVGLIAYLILRDREVRL
jgi:uncharacterized membrane protein YozB (DUF420 family)